MSEQFEKTGVFATPEQITWIKECCNSPVIGVTNPAPPGVGVPAVLTLGASPKEAVHRSALACGLPEISGNYGIDLKTGEFLKMREG